ncbi:MAG: amidohydrolase family protein [Planctomycetota bacterium]
MLLTSFALGAVAAFTSPSDGASTPSLFALKVGSAETVAEGTVPNAVILVENGKIVMVGEDLPVERGIPVLSYPDAVLAPGIVGARSRIGLTNRAGTDVTPEVSAAYELEPGTKAYEELLELGVTTLGLYPPGGGVVGTGIAIRTKGASRSEMILSDMTNLTMYIASNEGAKKLLGKAFELLDKYLEKVDKEREKFEKDKEKEKDKKKQEEMVFEPPVPDETVLPMLRLVTGDLRAVIGIRKASDYLHLLDVLGDREFDWDVQFSVQDDSDVFYIADRLGEVGRRCIVNPLVTMHPGTRRERNLPKELLDAGAKVAFVPNSDSVRGFEDFRRDVAILVSYGFDRQAALRAMTLEPAASLGVDGRVGSISVGKDANFVLYDGDPLEPATKIIGVMLEGDFVAGELAK